MKFVVCLIVFSAEEKKKAGKELGSHSVKGFMVLDKDAAREDALRR